jgi:hypothetical protein
MFQNGHVEFAYYGFLVYHWIPVLNPLASILTNRHYRDAILNGRLAKTVLCWKNNVTVVPAAGNNGFL